MSFKYERDRSEAAGSEPEYGVDVRVGLPLRVITQPTFDTTEGATDPPVYDFFTLPGT